MGALIRGHSIVISLAHTHARAHMFAREFISLCLSRRPVSDNSMMFCLLFQEHASKITGMLLELTPTQLIYVLTHDDAFKEKINEAVELITDNGRYDSLQLNIVFVKS